MIPEISILHQTISHSSTFFLNKYNWHYEIAIHYAILTLQTLSDKTFRKQWKQWNKYSSQFCLWNMINDEIVNINNLLE